MIFLDYGILRKKVGGAMPERGLLVVFSGPSGVGKGTVRAAIFNRMHENLEYSVSMTTRLQRKGESDGRDYYFRTRDEFEKMIHQGRMLEYAEYVGNYYGTPLDYVNATLDNGKDVLLEIEVQGALQVKEKIPDAIFIFLMPPDLEELRHRLSGRGTDSVDIIEERMTKAREEIHLMSNYDYAVVNDVVELAAERVEKIIESEHFRVDRVISKYEQMIEQTREQEKVGKKNDVTTVN